MRLLEILARDIKVWPSNASYAEQDYDKEVRFIGHESADYFASQLADKCANNYADDGIPFSERVTRDQWQSAVDAMNSPAWNGEGLPPVGISCEHVPIDGDEGWQKVEIIAHKNAPMPVAIFWDQKKEHVSYSSLQAFRPIRSAEQIAADQKQQEIEELMVILGEVTSADYKDIAEAIQKAGYRKQASE